MERFTLFIANTNGNLNKLFQAFCKIRTLFANYRERGPSRKTRQDKRACSRAVACRESRRPNFELAGHLSNRTYTTNLPQCDAVKTLRASLMQIGQRVRVCAPDLARDWNIPRGTEGTVVCTHRNSERKRGRVGTAGCPLLISAHDLGRPRSTLLADSAPLMAP
jgi:hypothetical protein